MPALTKEAIRARLSLRVSGEHRIIHKTFFKREKNSPQLLCTYLPPRYLSLKVLPTYSSQISSLDSFTITEGLLCEDIKFVVKFWLSAIKLCNHRFVPVSVSNVPYNFKTLASAVLCLVLFLMRAVLWGQAGGARGVGRGLNDDALVEYNYNCIIQLRSFIQYSSWWTNSSFRPAITTYSFHF